MNELLKRFLDYLGSIDGHKARQLMKRLNEFSAAASVWLVSTGRGTWEPWLTGAVYVISAALEFIASQRAQNDRARDVSAPEADVEVEEEFSKPDYDKIYNAKRVQIEPRMKIPGGVRVPKAVAPTERIPLPPAKEVQAELRKIHNRNYRVRVQQPGKRSKFIPSKSLKDAKKILKREVESGNHPAGTLIEVVPPQV